MRAPTRRVGVLTGGGDCPGLNAVIRAVTKNLLHDRHEVLGIEDGFLGLIENRMRPLSYNDVSDILARGGTILGSSSKANPSRFASGTDEQGQLIWRDVSADCLAHAEARGLDALVVIGGDGTMACAMPFVQAGLPVLAVPKTIDNDIVGTDRSFGFATAVQICSDAVDRVKTTADSHHRALVVEVMGRNAGWIALHTGVATGADVILIPEIPFTMERVCEQVQRRMARGRQSTIVVVAEGARPVDGERIVRQLDPSSPDPVKLGGISRVVAQGIQERTSVDARNVILGHVQRGGTPVASDRVLATRFGHHAAELLRAGESGRMVALRGARIEDMPMQDAAGKQRLVPEDHDLIATARAVWTYFCEAETAATRSA